MEDTASSNARPLHAALRSLARRGVTLHRAPDGSGMIAGTARQPSCRAIPRSEVDQMLAAGWLRAAGEGQGLVISRRGVTALRAVLSRPMQSSPSRRATPDRPPSASDKPSSNPKESPLAWLRHRRDKDGRAMIEESEFLAGEQLRLDFERAQLGPRVTASWDPTMTSSGSRGAPGTGMEMAEAVVAARQRLDRALKAVGPELSGLLLDVCCFLHGLEDAERNRGWPRRSGKVVLQLGLAHLARHYGLDVTLRGQTGRIRSWGTADYRPRLDGEEAA
jgi:hypothetical protein